MDFIAWVYWNIGSLFCHQLPERTLFINGEALPVCARDTGIYAGVFITGLYLYIRGRFDSDKPPRLFTAIVLCLLMLPMMADGVSSYLGFRNTTNEIRLATGLLFGIALPVFLIPTAHFKIYGQNSKEVLKNLYELLLPLAGGAVLYLALLRVRQLPWWLVSSMIVAGFLFLIARLIYTLVHRLIAGKSKHRLIPVAIGTISVLAVMYLVSHYLLHPLKQLLITRFN